MVDVELIKRCQQGEADAFDELYRIYGTKALRTAFLLVGKRDLAEDIMQETFYACYRDIKALRKPELFQVWFNRLLVRICWRLASKDRKMSPGSIEDQSREVIDMHDEIEMSQTSQIIREAVNKLNPPLRTTIILFYYNDMSIKEIAKTMNCLQGTVKSRLHNGKKQLAKALKSEMDLQLGEGCFLK